MASSSIVYSSYAKSSCVYLAWQIAETDIANNRWKIAWQAGVCVGGGNLWYSNAVRIDSVYIADSASLGSGTYSNFTANGTYEKLSDTFWIYADSTGNRTVTFTINGWFYGYGNVSGTQSIALDTIPRQATLTGAWSFTDEEDPMIVYSNPAGSAVTSLQACIADADCATELVPYRDIPVNESSYIFNLTDSERATLRQYAANSNSVTVTPHVKTVLGGVTYWSNTAKTMTIVNADPVVTASVEDTNETTVALTGDSSKLIKFYSDVTATMRAQALKSASIDESKYIMRNGVYYGNGTSLTFENVESNVFFFSAEDSRGNVGTDTIILTMIDYVYLTCIMGSNRPDATGNMTVACKGAFYNGSFGAADNELTVQYRYALLGGSFGDWKNMTVTTDGNRYYATSDLTGLDYQATYTFECRAIDKLDSVSSGQQNIKSVPAFHWGENDFVFEVPVTFNGGIHGTALVDLFHPVGSVYMSRDPTNPTYLFGGTWQRIKDTFILAAGDKYQAGSSGGEAEVALTKSQMPSHSHAITVSSGGEHGHSVGTIENQYYTSSAYKWTLVRPAGLSSDATHTIGGDGTHSHTASAENTGNDSAHNNMPPYLCMYIWERIG